MCETKLTVQYPNNNCGVWLERKDQGTVFFEADKGKNLLAFSNGKTKAYNIALSFNKFGLELQYHGSDKNGDPKFISVDANLVYDLLFDILKELEIRALALQPKKPIVK